MVKPSLVPSSFPNQNMLLLLSVALGCGGVLLLLLLLRLNLVDGGLVDERNEVLVF